MHIRSITGSNRKLFPISVLRYSRNGGLRWPMICLLSFNANNKTRITFYIKYHQHLNRLIHSLILYHDQNSLPSSPCFTHQGTLFPLPPQARQVHTPLPLHLLHLLLNFQSSSYIVVVLLWKGFRLMLSLCVACRIWFIRTFSVFTIPLPLHAEHMHWPLPLQERQVAEPRSVILAACIEGHHWSLCVWKRKYFLPLTTLFSCFPVKGE